MNPQHRKMIMHSQHRYIKIPILYNSLMMKLSILVFSILLVIISLLFMSDFQRSDKFDEWKLTYARRYCSSSDQFYRRKIFHTNLHKINNHNAQNHSKYQLGINQFADLTQDQFKAAYLTSLHLSQLVQNQQQFKDGNITYKEYDWVALGAVTPVKQEGSQCGACWAFSAIGPIETLSKISDGELKSFSQQQLIDCSQKYGNFGCNGGFMTNSFKFVIDKGIAGQNQYPYKGVKQNCQQETGDFKITGFVQGKNCIDLALMITKGTVSVAVDATNWYLYKSGIFDNCKSGSSLNFAAVLVGVSGNYWKLKNAWGPNWGQNGYIRLATGNTCGICQMSSIPYK